MSVAIWKHIHGQVISENLRWGTHGTDKSMPGNWMHLCITYQEKGIYRE